MNVSLITVLLLLCTCRPSRGQKGGVVDGSTIFKWHKAGSSRHTLQDWRLLHNTTRFDKPYKICTSAWAPIVNCIAEEDPSTYSGYQIELFREIAHVVGWQPEDWYFNCMDWTELIDDLHASNGTCFMAASGEHKAASCWVKLQLYHDLGPCMCACVAVPIDSTSIHYCWSG
jgi:ABC-type amino acid transport substrate-binding protein